MTAWGGGAWRSCLNQCGSFPLCPASLLHRIPRLYTHAHSKLCPSVGEAGDQAAGPALRSFQSGRGKEGGKGQRRRERNPEIPPLLISQTSLGQTGVGVKRAGGRKC